MSEDRHKFRSARPQSINRLLNALDEICERFGAFAIYVIWVASRPIRVNERFPVGSGSFPVARRRQVSKLLNLPLFSPNRGETPDRRLGALTRPDIGGSDDERRRLRKRINQSQSLLDPFSC